MMIRQRLMRRHINEVKVLIGLSIRKKFFLATCRMEHQIRVPWGWLNKGARFFGAARLGVTKPQFCSESTNRAYSIFYPRKNQLDTPNLAVPNISRQSRSPFGVYRTQYLGINYTNFFENLEDLFSIKIKHS